MTCLYSTAGLVNVGTPYAADAEFQISEDRNGLETCIEKIC